MSATAHYAILDEAGDIGQHARSTHYLVGVAVLTPSLHGMQRVAGAVRKLARKRKIRLEELKARLVPSQLVHEGLLRALEWDWELVVAVIEKESGTLRTEGSEELYRRLMVHLVERCVQRRATLRVIIDKRYNNQAQRDKLTHALETALSSFSNRVIVTLEQADSKARQELLIADYAAWAVFQKYERKDATPYQIVSSRIVRQEICSQRALLAETGDEETVWHPGG